MALKIDHTTGIQALLQPVTGSFKLLVALERLPRQRYNLANARYRLSQRRAMHAWTRSCYDLGNHDCDLKEPGPSPTRVSRWCWIGGSGPREEDTTWNRFGVCNHVVNPGSGSGAEAEIRGRTAYQVWSAICWELWVVLWFINSHSEFPGSVSMMMVLRSAISAARHHAGRSS